VVVSVPYSPRGTDRCLACGSPLVSLQVMYRAAVWGDLVLGIAQHAPGAMSW
jgi:hypothetical protein